MAITITTTIRINANVQDVWKVLTNFEDYKHWNPFIKRISGHLKEGQILDVTINKMSFKPKVLYVEKDKGFEWIGHLIIPRLFDGKHHFKLTTVGNEICFEQLECFSGILVPLFKHKINKDFKNQFTAMNKALKQHVEQGVFL